MSPVVFPVSFEELQARIDFQELAEERRTGHGYEVSAIAVRHPGGALGYRFTTGNAGGRALVYVSDNELSAEARYDDAPGWREKLVEFVRGASVLVHDTMYTAERVRIVRGWGHSTHEQAVELALDADVERLVLFHHRPGAERRGGRPLRGAVPGAGRPPRTRPRGGGGRRGHELASVRLRSDGRYWSYRSDAQDEMEWRAADAAASSGRSTSLGGDHDPT